MKSQVKALPCFPLSTAKGAVRSQAAAVTEMCWHFGRLQLFAQDPVAFFSSLVATMAVEEGAEERFKIWIVMPNISDFFSIIDRKQLGEQIHLCNAIKDFQLLGGLQDWIFKTYYTNESLYLKINTQRGCIKKVLMIKNCGALVYVID